MMRRAFLLVGVALFLGIIGGIPRPLFALGISPGSVVEERVPPNFELLRKFMVTRGNPSEDEQAKITVSGSGAQYIELVAGDVIELPKGMRAVEIPFKINTKSLGAETYRAELTATISPKITGDEAKGYGSRVLSGATGLIRFTVVNEEIEKYSIDTISILDSEVKTPVGFSFTLSNHGTVFARPEKIDLVFLENESGKEAYRETLDTTQITAIAPLSNGRIDLVTKATELPPAVYRGEFTFYNNADVVANKKLTFRVFPQGTLTQQGELVALTTEKKSYEPGESVKITGSFKNSGDVGVVAQLNVEIFTGERRIDTLTSKEVFIPKLETVDFELFYEQEEGGDYTAKGTASFGVKKSNTIEIRFNIKQFPLALVIGVIIGFLVIVIIILLILKRKKQKGVPPPTPTQQSTPQS